MIKIFNSDKCIDLSNESELNDYYNTNHSDEIRVEILTVAGPDMLFSGLVIQYAHYEAPEYCFFIFLTSKMNVVLAKGNYQQAGNKLTMEGYSVVGKDLPNGLVKFFGTDKKAKDFYRASGIPYYIEI